MNFYTSDQINSTRVVMDINGTIVFSAVYDPFGGILQTWTYDYDPVMKFSGKERDYESELDYFGARYYDHSHYRFTSVDPVINREEAFANPQLWNLYSYCRNNPVTYLDPDGRVTLRPDLRFKRMDPLEIHESTGKWGVAAAPISYGFDYNYKKENGKWRIEVTISFKQEILIPKDDAPFYGKAGMPKDVFDAFKHEWNHVMNHMWHMSGAYKDAVLFESIKYPSKFLTKFAAFCHKLKWGTFGKYKMGAINELIDLIK